MLIYRIWSWLNRSAMLLLLVIAAAAEKVIIINNLLQLYSAFSGTSNIWKGGISSTTTNVHPPGWCDGSHIVPECTPHTSLLVERRQSDEGNQYMEMIRRPWWTVANLPGCRGYTPTLLKDILGFLMTTESQDLDLTTHLKDILP